jgi:tRNA A-37 threonylcarbamoyl transferase component Bud32
VKRDPGTSLFVLPLGQGKAFLKLYTYDAWYLRLRARLFPSRARREFQVLTELARRGIPTLDPIACGERDRGPLRLASFLATVHRDEATTLEARLDEAPPRPERDELLARVARAVRSFHEKGFSHGNLFPRNLIVGREPDHPVLVFDAPFGHFHPGSAPESARAADLACLYRFTSPVVSASERARFLRIYMGREAGEGLGLAGKRMARAALSSSAFTRSVRRKLLFHLARLQGRPV